MDNKPKYFPMVDFLRGLGAIVILVWHYHHFYFTKPYFSPETGNPTWVFDVQPFYNILWLFYHHGAWAVMFFWVLSGFVFAHVYVGKSTNFRNFFILRFSRLYPLHIITLLTITALQFSSDFLLGKFQILAINDLYHFVLHLFFASNWGLEVGYSFNAPVWSVSVEEIVYWGFWLLVARMGNMSIVKAFILLLLAIMLRKIGHNGLIESCFFYFFAGAFTYKIFSECKGWKLCLSVAAGFIATSIYFISASKMSYGISLLFCGMVLAAAAADQSGYFKKLNKIGLFFGSITYSAYLWHMPIQVFVLIIFDLFAFDRAFFNHPAVFVSFVALVVAIGRLSYVKIERPLQIKIRKRFLTEQPLANPIPVAIKSSEAHHR